MLYIDDSIDTDYKYLVDYGSNYYVLSKRSYSDDSSGDIDYIPSVLCYMEPSFNYCYFAYPSSSSVTFSNISTSLTSDIYYSRDFPLSLISAFALLCCLVFIINGFTRIVQKGGVLFPH